MVTFTKTLSRSFKLELHLSVQEVQSSFQHRFSTTAPLMDDELYISEAFLIATETGEKTRLAIGQIATLSEEFGMDLTEDQLIKEAEKSFDEDCL